jgi:hypothetical protein
MYQSMVEGRRVPWELLVKDVPEDRHQDLDCLVEQLDWAKNVDEHFKAHNYLEPIVHSGAEGVPMLSAHFPLMSTGRGLICAPLAFAAMVVTMAQRITRVPHVVRGVGLNGIEASFQYLVRGSLLRKTISSKLNEVSWLSTAMSGLIPTRSFSVSCAHDTGAGGLVLDFFEGRMARRT